MENIELLRNHRGKGGFVRYFRLEIRVADALVCFELLEVEEWVATLEADAQRHGHLLSQLRKLATQRLFRLLSVVVLQPQVEFLAGNLESL